MRLALAGAPRPHRSRHAFRARYLLAGICGVSLLAAAGCGSPSGAGTTVSNTVTIAAVPGVDDAALYVAQKQGLFAAEGLAHVQIKAYSNQAAVLSALRNGQAEIAASDYGNVFYQEALLAPNPHHPLMRILADGYDATAGVLELLTLPGPKGIKSPVDLVQPGVKVGLPNDDALATGPSAPMTLDEAAATSVLSEYLASAAQSVQWVPMSQSDEIAALKDHQVRAILLSEPYIYQAESQLGAVEVVDACSGSTAGLPLLGYVAMSAWVRDNPSAVADFQAALVKAQAAAAVTGRVQQVLPGVLPGAAAVRAQEADLVTIGTYPTSTSEVNLNTADRLLFSPGYGEKVAAPHVGPMLVKPAG